MENAKQVVLIDEIELEKLYQRAELNWKRPTEYNAKTVLHRQMKSDLGEENVAEDIKVKQYNQDLNRFLNPKRKLIQEQPLIDLLSTSIDNAPTNIVPNTQTAPEPKKKKNKKPSLPVWERKRVIKTPKKFKWDIW